MHKFNYEEFFNNNRFIPIIVLDDLEKAIPIAKALYNGNIKVMEITLRTENALNIIKKITDELPEMIIGAGTVINEEQYHLAVSHGAKFIVSPGLTDSLAKVAKVYDIPFLPGAITPSEIIHALQHGYNYLKFFPSASFNGIEVLKSLSQPFRQVKFCPTGGITINNCQEFLNLNNVVAVGCSFLVSQDIIKSNDFEQITRLALELQQIHNH